MPGALLQGQWGASKRKSGANTPGTGSKSAGAAANKAVKREATTSQVFDTMKPHVDHFRKWL